MKDNKFIDTDIDGFKVIKPGKPAPEEKKPDPGQEKPEEKKPDQADAQGE